MRLLALTTALGYALSALSLPPGAGAGPLPHAQPPAQDGRTRGLDWGSVGHALVPGALAALGGLNIWQWRRIRRLDNENLHLAAYKRGQEKEAAKAAAGQTEQEKFQAQVDKALDDLNQMCRVDASFYTCLQFDMIGLDIFTKKTESVDWQDLNNYIKWCARDRFNLAGFTEFPPGSSVRFYAEDKRGLYPPLPEWEAMRKQREAQRAADEQRATDDPNQSEGGHSNNNAMSVEKVFKFGKDAVRQVTGQGSAYPSFFPLGRKTGAAGLKVPMLKAG